MGFFKKIFKGIGKFFKKIGKGIKKTFKSFGKFMDKIGIVGQIGMMFILPHMAGALFKGIGGAASAVGTGITGAAGQGTGLLSQLARGAGHVINGAGKFATNIGAKFTSIGNGIREFGKTTANALLPGKPFEAASNNFFGADSAWSKAVTDFQATPDLFDILPQGSTPSGNYSPLGEYSPVKTTSSVLGKSPTLNLKSGSPISIDTATENLMDIVVNSSKVGTIPNTVNYSPLGEYSPIKTASSVLGKSPGALNFGTEAVVSEEVSKSLLTKGFDKFKTNFQEAPIKTVKDAVSTAGLVSQAIGGSDEVIMDDDYDYGYGSGSVSLTANPIITGAEPVDNSLLNQYALTTVNNSYNPNLYGGNSPSPSDPYWLQWMTSNGNLSYG